MFNYLIAAASSFVSQGDWSTTSAGPKNGMGASNQFVELEHAPARLQHIWKNRFTKQLITDFFKKFGQESPFRGATDTPVLNFWWCLRPWVSKPGWIP